MKKHISLLFLAVLGVFQLNAQSEQEQLDFLKNYLSETAQNLEQALSGLNEAQLQFKPDTNSWSISQCAEHIIATEMMVLEMLHGYIQQPENPERREEIQVTDSDIITFLTDRSQKYQAPEMLHKAGKYTDYQEAISEFSAARKALHQFVDSVTISDLRNRVNDSPTGPVDAYQSLLFLAAHTARHTLQMEEVKAHAQFPK